MCLRIKLKKIRKFLIWAWSGIGRGRRDVGPTLNEMPLAHLYSSIEVSESIHERIMPKFGNLLFLCVKSEMGVVGH